MDQVTRVQEGQCGADVVQGQHSVLVLCLVRQPCWPRQPILQQTQIIQHANSNQTLQLATSWPALQLDTARSVNQDRQV